MDMDEKYIQHIYTLSDPRDGRVRYVGMTASPVDRYYQHTSTRTIKTDKDAWIQELQVLRLKPIMTIVESITYTIPMTPEQVRPEKRESYWIQFYIEHGAELFNKNKTGEIDAASKYIRNYPNTSRYPLPSIEDENVRLRKENARLRATINKMKELLVEIEDIEE